MRKQATNNIIMIRPKHFAFNEETAKDNVFQHELYKLQSNILKAVQIEFDNFVKILQTYKINIEVFDDRDDVITPDSIFPNNWVSFHQDGSAYIYKMFVENRKKEIRKDIFKTLEKKGFEIKSLYNLNQGNHGVLEGTGALVLDRVNQVAYCSISKRSEKKAFENWSNLSNFKPISFSSFSHGSSIYHTNVMMSIADKYVILCSESITDIEEKEFVISELKATKKEIIDITLEQVDSFLGNALQVTNNQESFLVMSQTAYASLTNEQLETILKYDKIISSDISTIEKIGGGSARCMLAENFLERK